MARFGTFRYGTGILYGIGGGPAAPPLLWSIQVAWNGTYTGDNEALRATGLTVTRGRDYLIKPGGDGFEHMQVGEAVVTLDNEDGRYDPWNVASPLYPNVSPGKFVRIAVKDYSTGINYEVMRGVIDDIQPYGKDRARLVVKDGLRWLKDRKILMRVYDGTAENTEVAHLIYHILHDSAGGAVWPLVEWGNAITGLPTTKLDYWWAWKTSILEAINDLEDVEFSTFYHNRSGKAAFKERNYVPATTTITQDQVLEDLSMNQPWELIRNLITIAFFALNVEPAVTLWQYGDPGSESEDNTYIAAGQTVTFEAEYTYGGDYPAAGVNLGPNMHSVYTTKDYSGADITASSPMTVVAKGRGADISITNNSGVNGYVIFIVLQGTAIYWPYNASVVSEDAVSKAAYGPRSFNLVDTLINLSDYARSYASFLKVKLSNPLMYPTIQLENRTALQFGPDLTELIHLEVPSKSIDTTFRIGKITHTWLRENGNAVRTTFKLEPYLDMSTGFWTLGTSQLGITTALGF